MTHEQTIAYLARIGVAEKPASAAYLAELQYHHLLCVPYENLDILRGIPISLSEDDLFRKIVVRRRGGYCFEVNRLFGALLRTLGFTVTDYAARYLRGESGIPMRRHHVLRVGCAEGEFLCDVGVGEVLPMEPVPYLCREAFTDSWGAAYRFREDPVLGHVLVEKYKGGERDVLGFAEETWVQADYETISFWCEHSPASIFRQSNICAIRREGQVRITLNGDVCHVFTPSGVEETRIAPPQMQAFLAQTFGIDG